MRGSNSVLQLACSCWVPTRRATTIHRPCQSQILRLNKCRDQIDELRGTEAGGCTWTRFCLWLSLSLDICACTIPHPLHVGPWDLSRLHLEKELFLMWFLTKENFSLYKYKVLPVNCEQDWALWSHNFPETVMVRHNDIPIILASKTSQQPDSQDMLSHEWVAIRWI